ncbi:MULTISPECIES: hypothetical protein [unclassified Lysobacter]|uniref:hypothetical protein n=1 Tax=unclassified Lysobacter TaxID=2635362 RepID=UPI0006F70FD4|nr:MULTISPECIES: hypothetical protein [unclassified Lysobacter]KQZ66133.1 hypothetical protein ASD53_17030 [Lysobacter sp. Root559]KRA72875.1 hypothetical protein ASD78_14765 [Lysobacter sp. Root667]KRC32161.1 hypothetical protein ASE10_16575 [Lysobacter sp. Root76]KRD67623.1 hypothetical protein ASE45_12750 [Lysobacter sp. Root96]
MSALRVAVLSLSILGLSACAGHSTKTAYVPPQKAPSIMDNDEVYMAQVERIARRRGIDVTWVNLPRKQVAKHSED